MLDGLLGRGALYSKCKSLIKQTRMRIDVIRRKRNATQKFMKKDIADLLANGLEPNAYGRTEGLIVELILASCYDFIDYICEIILKHLSVMQKHRECPEDCMEAVASLMYAAARFSDLPELRDLRNMFQERYGDSLEYKVNQKLVENIAPKPPSVETKLQLLQDIASEFSIKWDPRGFEQRMLNSSSSAQLQPRILLPLHAVGSNFVAPPVEDIVQKPEKNHFLSKERTDATKQNKGREFVHDNGHQICTGREGILLSSDEMNPKICKGQEITSKCRPTGFREEIFQKRQVHDISISSIRDPTVDSYNSLNLENTNRGTAVAGNPSSGKISELVNSPHKLDDRRDEIELKRDCQSASSQGKAKSLPTMSKMNVPYAGNNKFSEDGIPNSSSEMHGEEAEASKSNFRSAIPPPYVKPRKSKNKAHFRTNHREVDSTGSHGDTSTYQDGNRLEKLQTRPDLSSNEKQSVFPESAEGHGRYTEEYYKDDSTVNPTPRRRSSRRKHLKSSSAYEYKSSEEETRRVVGRISSSRRKGESRRGLQILFDDDNNGRDDEEERMIDKLLLHYSKKPSTVEPGNPRIKCKAESTDSSIISFLNEAQNGTKAAADFEPQPSRSISLPREQATLLEPKKVFARASSFQQETSTHARHVHPKLPDYDDLAARFAALRRNKE
ncbi:hypothetical protein Nepgr_015517 [Nepenthes gracilis]|uniref:IST1-like protein n=1 Tax=Nepenthes gracilis TaxID=150966 RepID=A0AAD3SNR6_NEPGR|nr:hypothetical protein Nepgr_015517 [Nepenthes gracilis]